MLNPESAKFYRSLKPKEFSLSSTLKKLGYIKTIVEHNAPFISSTPLYNSIPNHCKTYNKDSMTKEDYLEIYMELYRYWYEGLKNFWSGKAEIDRNIAEFLNNESYKPENIHDASNLDQILEHVEKMYLADMDLKTKEIIYQ